MSKHYLFAIGGLLITSLASAQCLTVSCNGTITVNNDPGQCTAVVNYTTPAITSNTCNGTVSDTFLFTGSQQTFVVPAGITSVHIDTWGAQGGANWVNNVNYGGHVGADIAVTPGTTLYVYVGGQPTSITGGYNGGGNGEGAGKGGGGASDVRMGGTTYNDRVVVAGGGGGAGYWSNLHVYGGEGGGLTGNNGYRAPDYATNPGGVGGSQTSSGNGTCVSFNNPSVAGGFGYGGTPSGCGCEGYGGGGGWYGGAGSGNCRGGGGGSGYVIPSATNVSMQTGGHAGNGLVIISYAGSSVATITQTAGLPSGSTFPAGTTTNTFVASDAFGNTATCTFDVYVTDTEVPVITGLPSNISVNADSGMCSAMASWTAPSVADNCTTTVNSNYASGATFNVGVTTVTYIATDGEGNADTASFTVTVIDTQQPWFAWVPSDTTVSNDLNMCSAVVTWATVNAMDNCSVSSVTSSANSGDAFPVGATTVVYVATDSSGNTDTVSFTVTVIDAQPPVATFPADVTVNADVNMCSASGVALGTVNAMDNCAVSINNDAPSVFPVGTTVVNYVVSDPAGNNVTYAQNVTVVDAQAPLIVNCPVNVTMCPGVIAYAVPSATDNCSATLAQVSGPLSGDTLSAGSYTVMFVATDSSGNADTCSFSIMVNANPTVTLSLPFTTVCVNDGAYVLQGASPAGGTWAGPGVSGNSFSPSIAGNGTQTIVYTYTDGNGCVGTANDVVTVSPCTGIAENGAQTFSMFPNPATDNFVFVANETGTMEMYDAAGKLVFTKEISEEKTEIDVTAFATGTYSVRFTGASGTVSNGKLVIQ